MHGTNAALVTIRNRAAVQALASDTTLDGAAGAGDPVDSVLSRLPYPTLDQVSRSVAIQRLQWLRHLPAPRTAAEQQVFQRIRTLGWSAPE